MNSTHFISCLSCQKDIPVRSADINLLYCPSCFAVFSRNDGYLSYNYHHAAIEKATEPIQPGTKGKWKEKSFEVTGRCRLYFSESAFNYWTIIFSDNSIGWLLEGYGLYFIVPSLTHVPGFVLAHDRLAKRETGDKLTILADTFLIEQEQVCQKSEIEGQVFFPDLQQWFTVFELSNTKGKYITAMGRENKELYAVDTLPVTKEELSLSNLRGAMPASHNFSCTFCSTEIGVEHYPYAQSCVCRGCGRAYSMDDKSVFKDTGHIFSRENNNNILGIGNIGTLNGVRYMVRGFIQKQEKNIYKSKWREYYLHSIEKGYATLSEFDGHWILMHEASETPVLTDPGVASFTFQNRRFNKYNRYSYSVLNAAGEFPHNTFNNEETVCYEYISPPHIWIYENDPIDGIRWFKGQHLDGKKLSDGFTLKKPLPYKTGVGAVSPSITDNLDNGKVWFATFIGFLFLLILHLSISGTKEKKVILSEQYAFMDSSDIVVKTTQPFSLDKNSANLVFTISAPVNNSWFSLDVDLVNTATGKEYGFEQGVEYYSGIDGGESWSEGSRVETRYLGPVPKGNYILQMQGVREQNVKNILGYDVEVKYDVPDNSNLWWCLGMFIIWPIIMFIRMYMAYSTRWNNSPFGPVTDDSDE